jgi:hypothetical protein
MAEEVVMSKLSEGSERSDAVTGSPIGSAPTVGELASATVTATSPKPVGWLRKTLKIFGPGLVTGAADDDPSGHHYDDDSYGH